MIQAHYIYCALLFIVHFIFIIITSGLPRSSDIISQGLGTFLALGGDDTQVE